MASTDEHDTPTDAGMPPQPDTAPAAPGPTPGEQAAAAATPVKRAPRKRAAKAAAEASDRPADAGAADPGAADPAETPKPRKRAARKKAVAAPASAETDSAPTDSAPTDSAPTDSAEADSAPTDSAEADSAQTDSAQPTGPVQGEQPGRPEGEQAGDEAGAPDGEAPSGPATSAPPSFGVLFQAPEPVVSRAPVARTRPQAADGAEVETDTGLEPDTETPEPTTAGEDEADEAGGARRRRRRGGKGRRGRSADSGEPADAPQQSEGTGDGPDGAGSATEPAGGEDVEEGAEDGAPRRRTRRRRRSGSGTDVEDAPGVTTRVREPRRGRDEVVGVRGSTRLEAKKQRRREGREAGRRRTVITEAEFLARRESVERVMLVREKDGRTQIAVLEDGVLVEHYVSRETNASMAGNIYLGKVQNVLPSMEAAFVDIGKGRNAVLYAGEVNWDAAGLTSGAPRRIENALESGQSVLVQVTKDPIGHKGARLTSQISLPGRFLVYVPDSSMTGISRKLPDTERSRLKSILREVVPGSAGVIVRTAAEGASEPELRADVQRLTQTWEQISAKADAAGVGRKGKSGAPQLLHGEPDLTVRVIRDVFNEDFTSLVVAGEATWTQVSEYVGAVAPDLAPRLSRWTREQDLFADHRVDEQIAKAMDRKVWLPSGGSLVIDRTEAMTVVDVNTGKFVGSGGNLEETVTRNNIEAAEEIVRQLRLRDIGGIIVIDFIDMVLESNRDLVVRRLMECLGRDRTKHQVAEVTSLGLVQMTRKRVGSGLIEVFSETCEHCNGRGYLIHTDPVDRPSAPSGADAGSGTPRARTRRGRAPAAEAPPQPAPGGPTPAQIAAAAHAAAIKSAAPPADPDGAQADESMPPGPDPEAGLQPTSAQTAAGPPSEGDGHDDAGAQIEPRDHAGVEIEPRDDAGVEIEPRDDAGVEGEPRDDAGVEGESGDAGARPGQTAPPADDNAAYPQGSPPARPRRRRGRVVAPAGPPPAAQD
ncbi:MAG: Rne/Rng family ribonuclease [Dermatophilaceae bacterium]